MLPGHSLDAREFYSMFIDAMSAGQSVDSLDRVAYITDLIDLIWKDDRIASSYTMSPKKGLCTISEKLTAHSKTHKIWNLVLLSVTLDSPSSVHSAVGGFNLDSEDFLSQGFSFVTPRKVGQTKWVKQTNKLAHCHKKYMRSHCPYQCWTWQILVLGHQAMFKIFSTYLK